MKVPLAGLYMYKCNSADGLIIFFDNYEANKICKYYILSIFCN